MRLAIHRAASVLICLCVLPAWSSDANTLIVVRDVGGVSALPYYAELQLRVPGNEQVPPAAIKVPSAIAGAKSQPGFHEADLLPVVSHRLTPGSVDRRELHAPGLTPMFLIGDDQQSRRWLQEKYDTLRALHAVGLVVNVSSARSLASLRKQAPGLALAPASGDDLARRLNLRHYPVLITATAIEQ